MIWVVISGLIAAAAWLGIGLMAIMFLVRGVRGSRRGDQLCCRRCAYSLRGLPVGQTYCPECGTNLRLPRSVRARYERNWRRVFLGCAMLVFNVVLLLGMVGLTGQRAAPAAAVLTPNVATGLNIIVRPPKRALDNDGEPDSSGRKRAALSTNGPASDLRVRPAGISTFGCPERDAAARRHEAINEYAALVRAYEVMVRTLSSDIGESSANESSAIRSRDARLGFFGLGIDVLASMPSREVRGDIARIVFHMSMRDRIEIADDLERQLRLWHRDDPVDDQERVRDALIADLPVGSNPFIEDPALVDQIEDY
jgi:hypothetical protein